MAVSVTRCLIVDLNGDLFDDIFIGHSNKIFLRRDNLCYFLRTIAIKKRIRIASVIA